MPGGYFVMIAFSSHPFLLTEHAVNGQVEASGVEVNIENGQFTFVVKTLNFEIPRCHLAGCVKDVY